MVGVLQRRPGATPDVEVDLFDRDLGEVAEDRGEAAGCLVGLELAGELDVEAEGVGGQPEAELVAGLRGALVERCPSIGSASAGEMIVAVPSLESSGQAASTSSW